MGICAKNGHGFGVSLPHMKIKFTSPYEGHGFQLDMAPPNYHVGIGSLETPQPRWFTIIAKRLDPVVSMRIDHTLSVDFKTLEEATYAWSSGFEVSGLDARTEVKKIVDHLLETQLAEVVAQQPASQPVDG